MGSASTVEIKVFDIFEGYIMMIASKQVKTNHFQQEQPNIKRTASYYSIYWFSMQG